MYGGVIYLQLKIKVFLGITFILILFSLILGFYFKILKSSDNKSTIVSNNYDYLIYIEIEDKTLYLLQNNKCIKKYPISSGADFSPSPLGCWIITDKDDWGEGFGGRWLGLNVPWVRNKWNTLLYGFL